MGQSRNTTWSEWWSEALVRGFPSGEGDVRHSATVRRGPPVQMTSNIEARGNSDASAPLDRYDDGNGTST
jgi:hypothetical protein